MANKVLVVDDEKLIVKGIRFSLEQDNMEVTCAYDGEEALELAKQTEYDMILLDLMLPKMNGMQVCEEARKKGVDIPPSLVNIYKELQDDLGCTIPNHGYLTKWAEQGVLMLNTVLTVRAHQANSHRGIGWEEFTDAAIMALNKEDRPIVFILWGAPAQRKEKMLNNPNHLILKAPHPSPLSAYRGFFGSKPFSTTNAFLRQHGIEPIDWQID